MRVELECHPDGRANVSWLKQNQTVTLKISAAVPAMKWCTVSKILRISEAKLVWFLDFISWGLILSSGIDVPSCIHRSKTKTGHNNGCMSFWSSFDLSPVDCPPGLAS
jgi:hypothetical protein